MAKSAVEWYDLIVAEKNTMSNLSTLQPNIDDSQQLLNDVTTQSMVARWRLWIWIIAVAAWMFETVMEYYLNETKLAAGRMYGTLEWYKKISLEFQYGDPLVWLPEEEKYGYAVVDTSKQIVKKVATIEANRQVRIKVADYVSGAIVPLSSVQLAAFESYINDLRPAGISTAAISRAPDLLKLQLKVYYNPLILSATGESLSTPGVFPVEDSINNYLTELEFGGVYRNNGIIDQIQATSGVEDPILIKAEARYGALPFTQVMESYLADAGYMIIDPNWPLDTTITYIPYV